ncbi:unnamed protein product [Boreogadus saida]
MRIDIYRDKNKTNQAWKEICEEFGLPEGEKEPNSWCCTFFKPDLLKCRCLPESISQAIEPEPCRPLTDNPKDQQSAMKSLRWLIRSCDGEIS